MGTMKFWDSAELEPKRQYKFLLTFTGGKQISQYLIKRADKPKFTVNAVQHDFLNHRFFYPGKLIWDPITITVVDVATKTSTGGNTSLGIMEAIKASGYNKPTSPSKKAGKTTISKNAATTNGLGTVKLETLNAAGTTVDTWTLANAFGTNVEFGSVDYTIEELVEVTLTLQYDYATLTAGTK